MCSYFSAGFGQHETQPSSRLPQGLPSAQQSCSLISPCHRIHCHVCVQHTVSTSTLGPFCRRHLCLGAAHVARTWPPIRMPLGNRVPPTAQLPSPPPLRTRPIPKHTFAHRPARQAYSTALAHSSNKPRCLLLPDFRRLALVAVVAPSSSSWSPASRRRLELRASMCGCKDAMHQRMR